MPKKAKANSIVYCDTSLVVDYIIAAGREPEANPRFEFPQSEFRRKERIYWEMLFRDEKRYRFATKLRSIVGWTFSNSKLIVSPFVLLELDEWLAEETFRRNALEGTHVKAIQTLSRKDIGKYIQQVYRDSKGAGDSFAAQLWGAMASSARGEAIAGIDIKPVDNLRFGPNAFKKVSLLSHMQMGMADIVHLLAAEALNCTHFASTDSDFGRLRDEIEAQFKFKILLKDEIFAVVKAGGNRMIRSAPITSPNRAA
jgi:hypothetical protein